MHHRPTIVLIAATLLACVAMPAAAVDNDTCLTCHSDLELTSEAGHKIGVDASALAASVHGGLECTDCHSQEGNWEDVPHFQAYRKVDCGSCHDQAAATFGPSFHGHALARGTRNAPDCASCHGAAGSPHAIRRLDLRSSEEACRRCHKTETSRYDGGVHAEAAAKGLASPGCTSCHPTHSSALPPSTGAVNKLCESCHKGSMVALRHGTTNGTSETMEGKISCASCHDVHGTHRPHLDKGVLTACSTCHADTRATFAGSVHEPELAAGRMNCLSCHRSHSVLDAKESEDFGCGNCHEGVEREYRTSAHRLARLRKGSVAASCADCHGGHQVLRSSDPKSPVHHTCVPDTCGKCHTNQSVVTSDYVRLPVVLAGYDQSVHGVGLKAGKHTANCSDCHGVHALTSAANPTSTIARENLARTCGQCHPKEAREYSESVHGRAVTHGIRDAPSCSDCHDEHMILATTDTRSAVSRQNQSSVACAKCHENPRMAARYGLPPEVIKSFEDSYHGWALRHGGKVAATCEDCHNTHAIGSLADPTSSIHPDKVVATCGRCHPDSNQKFAASCNHVLARGKRMTHDWVRIIYLWVIGLTLGGMLLHNSLIMFRQSRQHYHAHLAEPAVRRMTTNEVWQHLVLAVSFIGLAITGLALRFPDAWWVEILRAGGMSEEVRRWLHRAFAVAMVGVSVWHIAYLVATGRGRTLLRAMLPRPADVGEAIHNVLYHAGLRRQPPVFRRFDYTQKAEYWALIWGTMVMTVTGFVLMFPELTTGWLPAWMIRVAEAVHFWEAILAVGAIVIWHFFFTIFLPREYPMSWTWVTGRMPEEQWRHHHGREVEETGVVPEVLPGEGRPTDTH